jgi:glutathione S-transferase
MSNAPPVLYSFRRCPYAMRARLALFVSGVNFELREVVLRDKPPAMVTASAKGTVPVLVLNNGVVIDESIDIMRWALNHRDPEGWLEREDADLVTAFDGDFKHHLDRYKYATRHDSDPLAHRAVALAMLTRLEARLAERAFLSGTTRGFSDIAIFPFVRQFAGVEPEWFAAQHDIAQVQSWLDDQVASPLFLQAMVKQPIWQADAAQD